MQLVILAKKVIDLACLFQQLEI